MLNQKQCDIARLMTGISMANEQIRDEYECIDEVRASLAAQLIDGLIK